MWTRSGTMYSVTIRKPADDSTARAATAGGVGKVIQAASLLLGETPKMSGRRSQRVTAPLVACSIFLARSMLGLRPRQPVASCHRYSGVVPQSLASCRRMAMSEMYV